MAAFNIEYETLNNQNYRVVLNTTDHQQLVIMNVLDTIPREIHHGIDQFIRIEQGTCTVILNDDSYFDLQDGDSITIPAETYHEVIRTGPESLKLYSIYSPPHHPPGLVQKFRPLNEDD